MLFGYLMSTLEVLIGLLFWPNPAEVPSSPSVKSECSFARRVSQSITYGLVSLQVRAAISLSLATIKLCYSAIYSITVINMPHWLYKPSSRNGLCSDHQACQVAPV
jgi:hypothetical protein